MVAVTPSTSGTITKAQAVAYAHAVNLQAGDLPGFTSSGSETEAPQPGRLALKEIRCSGGASPARRVAAIESTEFLTGNGLYAEIMKSTVEVWPTPALVALNNGASDKSRARACFVRFLRALHKRINEERKGRRPIGPFTVTTMPNPLPGVGNSFLTKINETLLLRTGAVRARIYRDLFVFTIGPAEIELEAIGFSHPVPASTEEHALQLLLNRTTAHAP